jgi:lysylphosphatidylglycerol synthetase-like protein (DUF2156 family)
VVAGVYSSRSRNTFLLLALAFVTHVVAGLSLLFVLAGRRLGCHNDTWLCVVAGVCACIAMWHIQARYLLPGEALACIVVGTSTGLRWRSSPSQYSDYSTGMEF